MLLVAATGFAAYKSTESLLGANNWVRHTFLVIGSTEGVRAGLLAIESDSRGYLLKGDAFFLATIADARAQMAGNQKALRSLTADNSAQQGRIDNLYPLIDQRMAAIDNYLTVRREKGLAAALLATGQATEPDRTTDILNLLATIENAERTLLNDREQTAALGVQTTNRIIFGGSLLCFLLVALIGIATRLSITRRLDEFQQLVASVEKGDLTRSPESEGSDEMGRLAHGLNQIVTRLRTMAAQTRSAAANLNAATVEILASAKEQSAVTGEQVAAYQETSATMHQVSQSGLQITERAKQVTTVAEAVSLANTTGVDAVQKANQTVEAIHEQAEAVAQNIVALSEKTQMVGDILATVNDIAEQSHLLALNAAIEAAAAGEHGRTFSVVAGEIKNLADQSKAATVQVKTILGDIQKEINTSVMLTEEAVKRVDIGRHQADVAASAIRNMTANIDQSVQAFQQIVAGTNQQQIGFENVMQAMKDLSRGSEQAAASTRQTEKSAASLNDVGMQLRLATEGYLI